MNKVGSTNSGVEGEEKDGNDGSDKGDHNTGDEHSAKSEQSGENVLREKTQQNCSEKESEEGTPNDAPNDVPNDVPNDAPKDVDNSHGEEELKLSRAESDTIEKSREEPNAQGSKISTTSVDEEKEEHEINIIASTGDDYTVHEKPPSIVRGESEKDRGKKIRHKSFKRNDTYNEAKKGEINSSRNKKIMKENLKVDMRDFFFTSQEKDVYEYIPDTSNYAICHNEANELYKDVVTMNKHFLDEINVNIYSSPLDTYLSSMLAAVKEDSKQREVNPLFRANSKSENSNNNNNLSDEKKKEQSDILDESPMNKPLYSYEFYKNKIFKHYHNNGLVIEVDPAKLKYNNSTQYEYDQKVSTNLDDPLSYLQKLKCEVEDITTYINDLANRKREAYDPDNPYEKLNEDVTEHEQIVKKIMHNREPPEILLELFSLKNDIDDMINDDNLRTLLKSEKAEKMASKQGDTTSLDNCKREVVRDILNRLQNWDDVYPKKGEPTDEKNIQKDTRGNSFPKQVNIYTLQNGKEKEIQTAHLLTLERKIADIEKALGIDKMAMLPYDDLNHAILDLYNKLSLLDSIKLESVKKKMQNLQSEFLNLKKFKKDLLNISKDRGNYEESIDELFKILDLWKKTHHIIPNVLARLHQLKRVHDNAQSFSSRLDDLEKQQSKLDETLSLAEQNIKLINSKIDQNVHFLQDTLRKMESEGGFLLE